MHDEIRHARVEPSRNHTSHLIKHVEMQTHAKARSVA
jgi:hypothetical protein